MQSDHLKKLRDMLDDNKVCMMITAGANGELRSRPMSTIEIDHNGSLWFFTNEYSGKVDEIQKDHVMHLSYSSPSKNTFVSINATGELVDDMNKMKDLWNPVLKAWFPKGLEDPALLLIKASPYEIEYWDSPSSKIVVGLSLLKAVVTGETYDSKGDHGKISINDLPDPKQSGT